MSSVLPGIAGTLLPARFLSDRLQREAAAQLTREAIERERRRWWRWWAHASSGCGPASGLRALFDVVAMPVCAMLGFRARQAVFEPRSARAALYTGDGTVVALMILPWANRPSEAWRDIVAHAHGLGAGWCMLIAPPYVSLVDTSGHAARRTLDFTLPDVLDSPSFEVFSSLVSAAAFDTQAGQPGPSRIESILARAATFQDRVRDDLRRGVVEALRVLGPAVGASRSRASRDEALVIVYRMLFQLFAESRDLVPRGHPIYGPSYTLGSLFRDSLRREPPIGLWESLAAITRLSRWGCHTNDLVVRPFNGRLFARTAAPSLERNLSARRPQPRTVLRDRAVAQALTALASRRGATGVEEISYADLGVDQLGAVYERVLDLPLDIQRIDDAKAASDKGHSLERKQSGTFYTPQALAEFVVRRTLAPLVAGRSADDILALRIVDPSMGSGAFLVAACRFLAEAYQQALREEGRLARPLDADGEADVRRLVAERCLAGVDRNATAVQLARLSLWLTTLARDKPLSFLDHRLRTGDSLIGASADDLRRIHASHRVTPSEHPRLGFEAIHEAMHVVVRPLHDLIRLRDDTVHDVRTKESAWTRLAAGSSPLQPWRLAASAWCARWFWPESGLGPPGPSELRAVVDALLSRDRTLPESLLHRRLAEVQAAAAARAFFHWTLEFADVFYDVAGHPRAEPGFDAVIGNPPWEMLRHEPGRARHEDDRAHGPSALDERRQLVRFIRESGLYPSCRHGHVNLYQPFLERALSICKPGGRVGMILPWGFAADDGAAALRRRVVDVDGIGTIVGLDNAHGLFPIHRGVRFLVLVSSPGRPTREVRIRCGVRKAAELDALPGQDVGAESAAFPIRLTRKDLLQIGGRSLRLPDCRSTDDCRLLQRLASTMPPLGSPEGWNLHFGRELNATEDRPSFGSVGLPVVEGKHLRPFRVDVASAAWRMHPDSARAKLPDGRLERTRLGYRDVSGVANRLTLIAALVPAGTIATHTIFTLRSVITDEAAHFLCALFNSYVLNAVVRMLMGGHVTTSLVGSLPVPPWRGTAIERRIADTSERVSSRPDDEATAAFLQADVAALYGLGPSEFRRILAGFPLVAAKQRERAARSLEQRVQP